MAVCYSCLEEKKPEDFEYYSLGKKRKSKLCNKCRNKRNRKEREEQVGCVGWNGGDELYC